jgi:hypothetical protein
MRTLLLSLLLAACAGPSRNTLAETPTAGTRRPPSLAPPASGADKERYQMNQQFEDMRDAQQAHGEARRAQAAPPPAAVPTAGAPGTAVPAAKPPVKRGPAAQAPAAKQPVKRGPAEQAPAN